ncbi:uncharacterized protein LOC110245097 [Exaiptasia diaphana]|uniref:Integrase catalytic domain-containing protein n=1 Tax=Exaiptasia diaphana TaxID=2652724 RepID=A0A913YQA1_EXADI|nr:uncharacterized protein LOC110245097 [Exaiptasia diaphana]
MPSYVHSDRGVSFMSKEFQTYLTEKGITTSRTTGYNPAGNGQYFEWSVGDPIHVEIKNQAGEIPSLSVICRKLKELDLTRHEATKVATERFTPLNMAQRQAFFRWRMTIDPRRIYFLDETAFQLDGDTRTIGRCHTNESLPSYVRKGDARVKMSVLAIIGFDGGVLGAYPIHGNFNRIRFNFVLAQFLLALVPPGSFIVMDNASIHNEQDLVQLLLPRNLTLVKLPTYSYDLNPIEMVNEVAKTCARRTPGLLRNNMPFAIVNAFSQVTRHAVQNFYRKS